MAAARHPPSGALCCDRLLFARDSAAAADAAARERTRPLLRQAAASSTSGLPVHAKNGNLPSWWLLLATSLCVPIQITFGMLGIVLVPADIARIVGDESKARYLGITVTLMMIVQVCQPIFGSISDKTRSRFGRRRPYIILGQLTSATALVIMRSSTTFWPYCWGYQLYQVGNCIVFATWCAIQPALHERQRGQFGGYIKLCMGVGFLGAALLGFADGKRYLNHDQTWGILIVLQLPLMLAGIASFSATPGEQPIPDKTINWYTLPIKLSTECMVSSDCRLLAARARRAVTRGRGQAAAARGRCRRNEPGDASKRRAGGHHRAVQKADVPLDLRLLYCVGGKLHDLE